MRILNRSVVGLLAAIAFMAGFQGRANAAFILNLAPDGLGNVVANGSGTLNTSALNMQPTGGPFGALVNPTGFPFGVASLLTGATVANVLQSSGGLSGPATFGTGGSFLATSGSGDMVGLSVGSLVVPSGYVSGSPLSNQATWAGRSISNLGLAPGTYTYTWGSGANADSYTIAISSVAAIPEPSALYLFAAGGVMLLLRRRIVCQARCRGPETGRG